jgi:hypothetical protein
VTQHSPHRFDAYYHTLEVLDQLADRVLPLDFLTDRVRLRVKRELEGKIDGVSRHDLLVLAAALHDLGKAYVGADEGADHIQRGVEAARAILGRLGLTEAQKELVLAVIRHHAPARLREPGESWKKFERRGGLDLLYDAIAGHGANPYPLETVLHHHADILGRRGDETSTAEVERRKQVTNRLLARYVREHPEPPPPVAVD